MSSDAVTALLQSILRPVVRFALRHSLHLQDLIEAAKVVFIEEAEAELVSQGEKVTVSRLSLLSGLQRKDVARVQRSESDQPYPQALLSRVIGQWQLDPRFSRKGGQAKPLPVSEGDSSFRELVRSVSTDVNPGSILKELIRLGHVQQLGERVKLEVRVYVPKRNPRESLRLLAADGSDLIEAVERNIFSGETPKHLHAKTEFDNVPTEAADEIKRWFLQRGGALHEEARRFLAPYDRDFNRTLRKDGGRCRVVLGTFSFVTAGEADEKKR